jgi:uncharacterized protein (DUF1800 family)
MFCKNLGKLVKMPRNTVGLAAIFFLQFFGAAGEGRAQSPLELRIHEGDAELLLPQESQPSLSLLEASPDLGSANWMPLARSTGAAWGNLFPDPRGIDSTAGGQVLNDPLVSGRMFYRINRAPGMQLSDPEIASRFLQQATFGPTTGEINALVSSNLDFNQWISNEIAKPMTLTGDVLGRLPDLINVGFKQKQANVWYHLVIESNDQLRQRMAWALSQILVISATGLNNGDRHLDFMAFYDILIEHAFGNFRDLLEEVTYSPMMGEYLTYDGNQKASGAQKPDENYAREIMQLFTIGLWELHPDGSLKTDANGDPIPTYDNSDIETFARVFTGLERVSTQDRITPMKIVASKHDNGVKVLLDGVTTLPANQGTAADVAGAITHLVNHPNAGPFLCRQLIQRLTGSNPSPAYIGRVAAVFANNGSGVRGDLAAVARAILMDDEARNLVYSAHDAHGQLREPLLRFTHLCRSFPIYSLNSTISGGSGTLNGVFFITEYNGPFPQYPFLSPSVFNFYLPDYQPSGDIIDRGLHAPEFQIMNDTTAVTFLNTLLTLVKSGVANPLNTRGTGSPTALLNYTTELTLAANPDASGLIDHLDVLLTAGRLKPENRSLILDQVNAIAPSDAVGRVKRAIRLILHTPEFHVIY